MIKNKLIDNYIFYFPLSCEVTLASDLFIIITKNFFNKND